MADLSSQTKFKFVVLTLFPELVETFARAGIFHQAKKKEHISLEIINPRKFAEGVHLTTDDRPYGGGDGMIMMAEPLTRAMESLQIAPLPERKDQRIKVIYLSPQGQKLTDPVARDLASSERLVLLCGRYGGVDQRFLNAYVDQEISIGDYVLSGGELPACVLMETVVRFVPEVLGHADSAHEDSFGKSGLLEHPNFTRPREILGQRVPDILLQGNHKKIEEWKCQLSKLITLKKRPDLLRLSESENHQLDEFWKSLPAEEKVSIGLEQNPVEVLNKGPR